MSMVPDYCVLCQEPHRMTDSCLRSVKCKECGVRGHTRIDCPQTGTRGHTRIDCPQTGTRGHTRIDCPQTVPVRASHESRERVRSTEGGEILTTFRFDPMDKEEFLRSKGKRKRTKSGDIEVSTGSGERDPPIVLFVSFPRDVTEMKDVIKVMNVRPVKRRRIAVAGHAMSTVEDIINLDDSSGEESENTKGDSILKVIDIFSGEGDSDCHLVDVEKRKEVVSIILLSSDEEEVGESEKNNNAFHKLENINTVKDESEKALSNVNGENGIEIRKTESEAPQVIEKEKLGVVNSQALSQNMKGEYFEKDPDPIVLKEEFSSEHVAEVKLDLKAEEVVVSQKPKEKKSSMLEPGKYSVVSVHVEVFRSNKSSTTKLTQVGCTLWGEDQNGFFRAVKPRGLEKYLDTCKLGGDLLRALHMTREDDGTFQFRSQFDIIEHDKKINCVEERKALKDLVEYLRKIPNCVLIGVDEDTIAILDQRLRDEKKEKLKNIVSGFTCWKLVLKYLKIDGYRKIDLEEFYSNMVKSPLPSFVSAKDISEVLLKAVRHVMKKHTKEGSDQLKVFNTLCKKIEFLSRPRRVEYDRKASVENLEVYSSLRPCVSATISAQQMEQVAISSDSEDDCEVTGEIRKSTDQGAASEKSVGPEDIEQSLQTNPGITLQEIWRKQSNQDDVNEVFRKIEDKFKEINNKQQQLKETYGEKLDAALNVTEDCYVDDNDSVIDDDDGLDDDDCFADHAANLSSHLSRPLPLYELTNNAQGTQGTKTRKYNPTDSNFWQRGNKFKDETDSRGSVFCPRCHTEVKYRNICSHLQRVHSETSLSLHCQDCLSVVFAKDLQVHVDRKCFVDRVDNVQITISPGPQTAPKPSDGYLDTVCLPGMWVMSDPCPQSKITEPWTQEQLSKALSDEQLLRTYLEDYLRHNYGPKHGAKVQCTWMYTDYQQHTKAVGWNHVLSPKKFLVVVSDWMLRELGVSVGPFISSMGAYQVVASLSQLYFQGLIYKVKS